MSTPRPEERTPAPAHRAIPAMARRLRELRRGSRLTLEVSAGRAGLSVAHLSRLETGRRQPSLPVLLALARTYGTTASDLLGEQPPPAYPLVRAAGGRSPVGEDPRHGPGEPGRALRAVRIDLLHGARDALVHSHPGEEWLYVLEGHVAFTLDASGHTLEAGDSAHYESVTPHRVAAAGGAGATLLLVHAAPHGSRPAPCLGAAPLTPTTR